MADILCADLSDKPVAAHLSEWLAAVQRLEAVGELARAQLLLETILQAREDCAEAYALLVHTHLQWGDDGHLFRALQIARCTAANNSVPACSATVTVQPTNCVGRSWDFLC